MVDTSSISRMDSSGNNITRTSSNPNVRYKIVTSSPVERIDTSVQVGVQDISTQANAIVIDTFGGSGSTLMACEQMNRICYTMELDEKYASVILRRYVEDTNDSENVYVIRDGVKILYKDLVKEVEVDNG